MKLSRGRAAGSSSPCSTICHDANISATTKSLKGDFSLPARACLVFEYRGLASNHSLPHYFLLGSNRHLENLFNAAKLKPFIFNKITAYTTEKSPDTTNITLGIETAREPFSPTGEHTVTSVIKDKMMV